MGFKSKEVAKEYHREYTLKNKFGVDLNYYNKVLHEQGYKCDICGKLSSDSKKALHLDHDHETGFVRGDTLF